MCAVITWPFFSFTRKVVLGRVWMTSPSIWIASSLDTAPYTASRGRGLEHEAHRSGKSRRSARDCGQAVTPPSRFNAAARADAARELYLAAQELAHCDGQPGITDAQGLKISAPS